MLPSQPIRCNDKTNRALVSCEFPRLKAVSFDYPDFRLTNCYTKLSSLLSSSLAVVTSRFGFMMPIRKVPSQYSCALNKKFVWVSD